MSVIKIVLFSLNQDFERLLRETEPLDGFTHDIICANSFSPWLLADADVAIFNTGSEITPRLARSRMKPGAKLVFVFDDQSHNPGVEGVDDFWRFGGERLSEKEQILMRIRLRRLFESHRAGVMAKTSGEWLNALINSMPDMVWFKDIYGVHHKVNDAFCSFVGKPRDRVEGQKHAQIWDVPETDNDCQRSEQTAIAMGETYITDEVVKSGGDRHLLRTHKTPIYNGDGSVFGTVGFARDMTNMLNLDMEFRHFIEAMPFPVILCGMDGAIRQANTFFHRFFNTNPDAIAGKDCDAWLEGVLTPDVSPLTGEDVFRLGGGDRFVVQTKKDVNNIFGEKVGGIRVFKDITVERDLAFRIWKSANTDELTGLSNRHALENYAKSLSDGQKLALFYLDLDGFKAVNDTYGHKTGDQAIRLAADSIREAFDGADFMARLGGDEFMICVAEGLSEEAARGLADKFLDILGKGFEASESFSRMSASVGVLPEAELSGNFDQLVKRADEAMYQAKKLGKGRCHVWRG